MTIGDELRGRLRDLGKSQRWLAQMSDTTDKHISLVLNNKVTPSLGMLTRITMALGLEVKLVEMENDHE